MDKRRLQNRFALRDVTTKVFIYALALLHLQGCSVVSSLNPWSSDNSVAQLTLIALPNANQRYSVAVDIVFVWDADLAVPLNELTAQQWFSRKQDYQRAYPDSLKIIHSEPMPGHTIRIQSLPDAHSKAKRVIVFANYINQQLVHRADITTMNNVRIVLQETTFSAESEDELSN